MIRLARRIVCCMMIASFVWCSALIPDSTIADGTAPLLHGLREEFVNLQNVELAKRYLRENLPKLWNVMNQGLAVVNIDPGEVQNNFREVFNYLVGG